MPKNDQKAREILELCLSSELPEYRHRVYEIISLSGLDASDPMFLILALTGQIKVFLESAPNELHQLLAEWKQQNADSLSQIQQTVTLAEKLQQSQLVSAQEALKSISADCSANIKKVGMETANAIAEANGDTLEQLMLGLTQKKSLIGEMQTS